MAEAPVKEFSGEITELADKLVGLTVKDAQSLVDCLKDQHGIEPDHQIDRRGQRLDEIGHVPAATPNPAYFVVIMLFF